MVELLFFFYLFYFAILKLTFGNYHCHLQLTPTEAHKED